VIGRCERFGQLFKRTWTCNFNCSICCAHVRLSCSFGSIFLLFFVVDVSIEVGGISDGKSQRAVKIFAASCLRLFDLKRFRLNEAYFCAATVASPSPPMEERAEERRSHFFLNRRICTARL
jgi:hypothetical protein